MEKETAQKILTVKNLTVKLGEETVIDNLSFNISRGEHFMIIGPNGSGKTTLFRALIGVLPYSGEISWAPTSVIGYVPQKLDLERNVPLSLRDFLHSKTGKMNKEELEKYLDLVNLSPSLLGNSLGTLSGGEFQRALVAFALIGGTNVLLFDEPTAGIDEPTEQQIHDTLHKLKHEHKLTIITISHDLSNVYRHSDRVLCLNKNQVCLGVPKDVLKPDILTDLYGDEHHKFFTHNHHDKHRNA